MNINAFNPPLTMEDYIVIFGTILIVASMVIGAIATAYYLFVPVRKANRRL